MKFYSNTTFCLALICVLFSCKTDESNFIVHKTLNKQYVLIQVRNQLQSSDDEVSVYIDSIIDGFIQANFISTGQRIFDLLGDTLPDIGFEIIDLRPLNPNGFPAQFDTLAARVLPMSVQIRDNSTFGYCDALNKNESIDENGNWSSQTCVLGTFMNVGQFQGQGEEYLAFRFNENSAYKYGWIRIYCSQHNDTLKIIDYGYNTRDNSRILSGQTE